MNDDAQLAASGVARSAINSLGDAANLDDREARAALLDALDAVPRQWADAWLGERDEARAEVNRLREALHVVLDEVDLLRAYSDRLFACEREGCPAEGCDDHDPQYVWGYVGRVERAGLHARAVIDPED